MMSMSSVLTLSLVALTATSQIQGFIFGSSGEVCYHDHGIGCFSNAAPFYNANNKLPESPDDIQTEYLLYTRTNTDLPQWINPDPPFLHQSNYLGTRKTKFIIHGYSDNARSKWFQDMKDAILNKEDVNVILVNWQKGADSINYFQAAANTRVVGALIAKLMESLNTTAHARYGDMHLIGHSLGAHIAGYAGEIHPTIGRITGLDPAGPSFETMDPKVRLDPTDAVFVDAIHTDGHSLLEIGFGLMERVADADYYPNGGADQPGCSDAPRKHLFSLITLEISAFVDGVACSHMRVIDYFTDSIQSSCPFTAYPCGNSSNFDAGHCNTCGSGCVRMGYYADHASHTGTFYLNTSSHAPYCLH